MKEFVFLTLAALLEVGGDAVIRTGLRGQRMGILAAGAGVLFAYGVFVNLPKWDFSRLMGVYIAIFFCVAQSVSILWFKERLQSPTILGGVLIVSGGLLLTLWRA